MKLFRRLVAFLSVLLFGSVSALADISGTNAVTSLTDNVNNVTSTVWPIVIAVLTALVAISVFMRIGRKAGIKA